MGLSATDWSRGRILGRGSTATVFLASSSLSSGAELFAVKSADIARSEFLQREQRIHSSIAGSHHIISYLGFDVTTEPSGTFYNLFLEYAPGGSLIDEIRKNGGKLGEAQIRARTRDIVMGLAHLHSKKIAHCDVKGQNVLLGCDGRAKLADFGCSRFVEGDGRRGQFSGTPMFMAPEVARGEVQGPPADVWAVGCTVIEMATGRAPWPDATDAVALIHRVAFSGDVPEVPTWLSEEGKDFMGKCLCREAGERWTAEQLLQHPFLSENSGGWWTSPKSTLDRSIWDSLMSESDNEEENNFVLESTSNKPNAIGERLEHGANGPNWTWDEDWVTVRIDDNQSASDEASPTPAVIGSRVEIAPVSNGSTIISTSISTREEDEFLFSTISAVKGDECDCKRDAVRSYDNCQPVKQCSNWLSNWIFFFTSTFCFCPLHFAALSSVL